MSSLEIKPDQRIVLKRSVRGYRPCLELTLPAGSIGYVLPSTAGCDASSEMVDVEFDLGELGEVYATISAEELVRAPE